MIASGSKGNACYIESNNTKIIIDCGISFKRIVSFFNENNIEMDIDAMLITHEHIDHVNGLKLFGKNVGAPVYMTPGTKEGIIEKYTKDGKSPIDFNDIHIINNNEKILINELEIQAIPLSHDVYDPIGFIIRDSNTKAVYITDTGYVPERYYEALSDADIYVMETNHDPVLLMQCEKRPYETRIRILGDKGHLSNDDALELLAHIIGNNTKLIFYAHISEECNLPELISASANKTFKSHNMDVSKIKFIYTSQKSTEVFDI